MTTKEVAAQFKMTGKELRRILRSFDKYADGKYTRYNLGKSDIAQIAKRVDGTKPAKKTPKATRKQVAEATPPPVETSIEATV